MTVVAELTDEFVSERLARAYADLVKNHKRVSLSDFESPAMYRLFRVNAGYATVLWVSRRYIIAWCPRLVRIREWREEKKILSGPLMIVGLDDEGLLFAHLLSTAVRDHNHLPFVAIKEASRNGRTIYWVDDREVRAFLGFDEDVGMAREVVLNDRGRYRVQGDLCLATTPVDDVRDEWVRDVVATVRHSLERAYAANIAERIVLLLAERGISASMASTSGGARVAAPGAPHDYDKCKILERKIAEIISQELVLSDLQVDLTPGPVLERWSHYVIPLGDTERSWGEISVDTTYPGWGERHGSLTVDISIELRLEEALKLIAPALEDMGPGEVELRVGRHRIIADNAYPIMLDIDITIGEIDGLRRTYTLPYRSDIIHMERGTVKVIHPQHEDKILRVERPMILHFYNTDIPPVSHESLNYHAFRLLIK